jgi:hypothetical protein
MRWWPWGRRVSVSEPTLLHYRLGRSVVKIDGSRTTVDDSVSGKHSVTTSAAVTVAAEADPDVELQLKTSEEWFHDRDFTLTFADDGRLLTANSTGTGVGAAAVEAGVRLATSVVALAARIAPAAVAEAAPAEEGAPEEEGAVDAKTEIEAAYAEADPDSAATRRKLLEAIGKLTASLAALGTQVAEVATPAEERELLARFRATQTALTAVRAEAASWEARFDAWRATTTTQTTTKLSYTLSTDELYEGDDVDELSLPTADFSERLRPVAEGLNLIVALTADPNRPAAGNAWNADEPLEGLYFRVPRRVVLSVYETTDDLSKKKRRYVRTSRQVVWLIDEHSRLDYIAFDSHLFGKHSAGVELNATGAVSKVTSNTTSAVGEAAKAISASFGQAQETLDQATKMSDSWSKLRSAASDDRLAALKRQKDELETTIATKGIAATEADVEKLATIKAQIDLATANKSLHDLTEPAPPDELAQLKQRLEKAQTELALQQVQAQLNANQ